MKLLATILSFFLFIVCGVAQTRNVLVNTSSVVVQPTNFWSADSTNARSGLGLGSAATNSSSAFQPSSSILSNLAVSNGYGLTNVTASFISSYLAISNTTGLQSALDGKLTTNGNAVGLTNFPTQVLQSNSSLSLFPTGILRTNGSASALTNFPVIPISSGGTGGTNAATARDGIGIGTTNTLTISAISAQNITIASGGGIELQATLTNAASFRTNIGLPWDGLTSVDAPSFRTSLSLGTASTNPSSAFQPSSSVLSNLSLSNGGLLTNIQASSLVGSIPSSNIPTFSLTNAAGVLSVSKGGTGATNATVARQNLGSGGVGDALFVSTTASTARAALGASYSGNALFTITDPSNISFLRINADNTVSTLNSSNFRTAIGLGSSATNSSSAFQPFSTILSNFANGGAIAISNGGTGATTASNARKNLELSETNVFVLLDNLGSNGYKGFSSLPYILGSTNSTSPNNQVSALNSSNVRVVAGLTLPALTNTTTANFRSAIGLASYTTNPVVPITNGGTGATNASTARANLGLGSSDYFEIGYIDVSSDIYTKNAYVNEYLTANTVSVASNISFVANAAAITRTNLGLGFSVLTNTNAANFRTNIGLGWSALTNTNSGTAFVSVNSTGVVVSPTNFWTASPLGRVGYIQYSTPIITSTNAVEAARNLFVFSLAPSISGVTNTVQLPVLTNGALYGDIAVVVHKGPTNSATTVRNGIDLITLTESDEAISLLYGTNGWDFYPNLAFHDPIYFTTTNASLFAAQSRTNLGLPLTALTNTNTTNFQAAVFNTNTAPTNTGNIAFNNAAAWMEVNVVTNGSNATFRVPLFKP